MNHRIYKWALALAVGFFLVVGLFAAKQAHAANPFNDARAATRLISSTTSENRCSAVVIRPEFALTARHCVGIPGRLVDGKPATVNRAHPTEDIAELHVPGLACPCVAISPTRPMLDETVVAVGYLFGEILIVSRGEYMGPTTNKDEGSHYGVFMGSVGPGMSGGGVFRVYVTGEVQLAGILSGMAPTGAPGVYVEVSKDAGLW